MPNSLLTNPVWTTLACVSAAASVGALVVQLLRWRGEAKGSRGGAAAQSASRHGEIG